LTPFVQKLNELECQFRPQPQFGIEYNDNDFILFRAQMLDLHTVVKRRLQKKIGVDHVTDDYLGPML
jgi:hypothetical protein